MHDGSEWREAYATPEYHACTHTPERNLTAALWMLGPAFHLTDALSDKGFRTPS